MKLVYTANRAKSYVKSLEIADGLEIELQSMTMKQIEQSYPIKRKPKEKKIDLIRRVISWIESEKSFGS